MQLIGRDVSHKTLSYLVAELELLGFIDGVERKGQGGTVFGFYMSASNFILIYPRLLKGYETLPNFTIG